MLSNIMLNVIMLSIIMMSVIMLAVTYILFMLSVVILSVVAPLCKPFYNHIFASLIHSQPWSQILNEQTADMLVSLQTRQQIITGTGNPILLAKLVGCQRCL